MRSRGTERVREEAKRIVTEHPEWVEESGGHRPGKQYVRVGRYRVYFRRDGLGIKIDNGDIYCWRRWPRILKKI